MRKNILYRILIVAATIILTCGCSDITKLRDINVMSVSIASFSPTGLRSAKAGFNVRVDNPAMGFTLSEISGTVYHNGKRLAEYTVEDVTLERRTEKTYRINGAATLSEGSSITDLLKIAGAFNPEEITFDLHTKATTATKKKLSKSFDFKEMQLSRFMDSK